jgi:hypothetical protein
MTFLSPALLAGLLAIAIPILVHLVQRERKTVVPFPSLMFLRRIPHQSVRRRAIRHWPLLVLRILAVCLIVAAFARPFVRGADAVTMGAVGTREVVILLDRSYSMGYGDHWARARDAAVRAVKSLRPGDLATLAFFSTDVEIAARSVDEGAGLLASINRAAPGAGATRLAPALRAASGILEASRLPRREIVLISDFQAGGWDRAQDSKLPPGVGLTPVSVAESPTSNAAIGTMMLGRETVAGGERITPSVRLVNRGPSPATDRQVGLEVDGRVLETRRVSIGADASATVMFKPFMLAAQPARVTARLAPDRLAADDVFFAVVAVRHRVPVLVLESVNPALDSSLYLTRALAVGGEPGFDVEVVRSDQAPAAAIATAAVIVLNDVRPPSGAGGRAIEEAVRKGAGLLVALGERSAWRNDDPNLLPGLLGSVTDRSGTRGGTLGFVDYSHPVFEIFSAPRSGDLTAARIFKYRQLSAPERVLARFDDGGVAFAERHIGKGTVLAWTSTFDSYWNDLALKPVFVPLILQAMKTLGRYAEPRPWQTVGDLFDQAAVPGDAPASGPAGAPPTVLAPGGGVLRLNTRTDMPATSLTEAGFYQIRPSPADASHAAHLAVNVAAAESDLTSFDPAELVAAVTASGTRAEASRNLTLDEHERRQSLWWYLLASGLILLAVEAAVASLLPRVMKP